MFPLDASAVQGATEVAITKVDLYFRSKPKAFGNKSGIENPGVEVMILPTTNGLPTINQIGAYRPTEPTEHGAKFAFYSGGQTARVEYNEILASTDASLPTSFLLSSPAIVRTNQQYSIVIKFDGNEDFILWQNKLGQNLIGSNVPSPGPSGNINGALYSFISNPSSGQLDTGYGYTNTAIESSTSNNSSLIFTSQNNLGIDVWDPSYLQANWNEIPNTSLKFKVYAARYFMNGVPTVGNTSLVSNTEYTSSLDRDQLVGFGNTAMLSNNVLQLFSQTEDQEYILFSRENSVRRNIFYGETVYQEQPFYPGGVSNANSLKVICAPNITTVNTEYKDRMVEANGSYVLANGSTFSSVGGFTEILSDGDTVIFTTANGDIEIKSVVEVVSNTVFLVDAPFEDQLTNTSISFCPVGFINDLSPSYIKGKNKDILTLYDSVTTPSKRFVSHSVYSANIADGGTGYANSDYLILTGFEDVNYAVKGNYAAYANIVTNANGTITNLYFSNLGAGFVNNSWLVGSNVSIYTSNSGVISNVSSSGTGANLTFEINSRLKSAFTNTVFSNCEIINLDAIRMKPEITVNNPVGTAFTIKHRTLYYKTSNANTADGYGYYLNSPTEQENTDTYVKIFKGHNLLHNENQIPVIPSRSNQYVIRYANGESANAETYGTVFSNSAVYVFNLSSNNDFQAVYFDPEIINAHYANYIVNREYSLEHTNFGAAWAKHICTKVNFAKDRLAEDLLVYLTAYRPYGSDIKVYAKIHNSKDSEEFDDKEWTLLDLVDGINVYSSKDDSSDFVELTYNFSQYPNTEYIMLGSATVYQGNAYVTGVNSSFSASFLINAGGTSYSNGDLVKAYAPVEADPGDVFAYKEKRVAIGVVTTNSTGGITSITMSNNGLGFTSQANVSNVAITNSTNGSTGGSSANVYYNPGLMANDVIKIYSPLFPETNYVVAVVNSIVNSTVLTVKNTFGDLAANGAGTVSVNATSTNVIGTSTTFTTDYDTGDFIAVWANSTVYETRKVASVTNTTHLIVESAFTFANATSKYAYVTPDIFVNNSISVSDLKIDKVHYKYQAFNNILNENVVRYYSNSKVAYDGYDTFQIKVVMLSNSEIHVPKIDDIRAIGATA